MDVYGRVWTCMDCMDVYGRWRHEGRYGVTIMVASISGWIVQVMA